MSVLIKGAKPPSGCGWCYFCEDSKCALIVGCDFDDTNGTQRRKDCPLIELPPDHGDLIDRDAFRKTMYHDTFETDSDLQKWESGCWIRYKMFERNIESAPVVIPAERE